MGKITFKQGICSVCATAMLAACVAVSLWVSQAFATGFSFDGNAQKQEVVYATLNAQGTPEAAYVVNSFDNTADTTIKDYGNYTEVTNLSDNGELGLASDSVVFSPEGDSFSYQGSLASAELPWIVSLTYYLDGVEVEPAQLAGVSGHLEIVFSTRANTAVESSYFDNYLLQASCNLDREVAHNVQTEQGSIALSGSQTTVTFMAMPGSETTASLTCDVTNFEMSGFEIAAVPFSMVLDLPDTDSLMAGFDALIEGTEAIADGAQSLASGSQILSEAQAQVESGLSTLSVQGNSLSEGLSSYVQGVSQTSQGAQSVAFGSQQFADSLVALEQASDQISVQLNQAQGELEAIEIMLADLQANYDQLTPEQQAALASLGIDISGLQDALGQTGQAMDGLQDYTSGVGSLAENYAGINSGIQQVSGGLSALTEQGAALIQGSEAYTAGVESADEAADLLAQATDELAGGASELADGTEELAQETQGIPDTIQNEIDNLLASYDTSDFSPHSYVSPKNSNTTLVQFVMTTASITLPEEPVVEEEEPSLTLWDRLLALFA